MVRVRKDQIVAEERRTRGVQYCLEYCTPYMHTHAAEYPLGMRRASVID